MAEPKKRPSYEDKMMATGYTEEVMEEITLV